MKTFEYRSSKVTVDKDWGPPDELDELLTRWGNEGWDVFSVIVPHSPNFKTYRVTAKREIRKDATSQGRKFR